jgi:hypothetical protein
MQNKGGVISAFVNPQNDGTLAFIERACLLYDENGRIDYFGEVPAADRLIGYEILLREKFVTLPGLIDLHTHLPQYEFASQGAEALLPWLNRYTFPQEGRFSDDRVAELQSLNFFQKLALARHNDDGRVPFSSQQSCGYSLQRSQPGGYSGISRPHAYGPQRARRTFDHGGRCRT